MEKLAGYALEVNIGGVSMLQGPKGDPGPQGDPGAKGDPGADGSQGKDGADGITPTIGENGNWYLGETDTGKPSRGANGDKGDPGAAGHSPVVTATKSGSVTTVKVDDKAIATINDGKTPARGTDYWTEADKAAIVADVIAALPAAEGVSV